MFEKKLSFGLAVILIHCLTHVSPEHTFHECFWTNLDHFETQVRCIWGKSISSKFLFLCLLRYAVIHIVCRFNLSLVHSVTFFPPLGTSFFRWLKDSQRGISEKVKIKSPETLLSFPLLRSRSFLRWIWEKTREASPPYTLLHAPLPFSRILSFTHFLICPVFSRLRGRTNTHGANAYATFCMAFLNYW